MCWTSLGIYTRPVYKLNSSSMGTVVILLVERPSGVQTLNKINLVASSPYPPTVTQVKMKANCPGDEHCHLAQVMSFGADMVVTGRSSHGTMFLSIHLPVCQCSTSLNKRPPQSHFYLVPLRSYFSLNAMQTCRRNSGSVSRSFMIHHCP